MKRKRFFVQKPLKNWKKGDPIGDRYVSIGVNIQKDDDGKDNLISATLTEANIDYEIQTLKNELDDIGKEAKKTLRELKEQMLGK